MKKFFLRLFIWLFVVFGIFILILIGVAAFYQKEVGSFVINELKKSLKTELSVESAELSLIWGFPNASVTLKNVKLKSSGKSPTDLIVAENISLSCGILGFFNGKYKFKNIHISNAKLFIDINKDGLGNYDIFKSDNSKKAENEKFDLTITDASFGNVRLEYRDERFRHNIRLILKSASFSGNFTDEHYDLNSKAKIISEQIAFGEDIYFKGKEIGYDAIISIDNKTNSYAFKKFNFDLQGNVLKTEGSLSYLKDGLKMDLSLNSDNAKLGPIMKLLPNAVESGLGGFESNADMNFNASIKGIYSATSMPKTDIKFGLKDGKLSHPNMAINLKSLSFDATYNHPGGSNKKDGRFKLNNFSGSLSGNPINLEIEVIGTENPLIDFLFKGKIPMNAVYGFFGKQASDGSGNIDIQSIELKGHFDDIINPRKISEVALSGELIFDNARIVSNGISLALNEGTISLEDNVLTVKDLKFKSDESAISANGKFENLLPVLFSDSLNTKNAALEFNIDLNAAKINCNELMSAFSTATELPKESDKTAEELKDSLAVAKNEHRAYITEFLSGKIKANCDELIYNKIIAKDIDASLVFEYNVLKIMGVEMDAFNGKMGLNAKIKFEKEPSLQAFFDCQKVDMYELLDKTDNFGQTTLTSKNLRGQLNAIVKINAYWDSTAVFDYDKLNVVADLNIKKGELINFELMKSLGTFVKLKDLDHIRFNELSNQLQIKNKELLIPAMFIQSNAINLLLSGKHGFNQDFDYKFKINAGQVLAQKMKKYNPKLALIPARKKGIFNIYCSVFGNINKEEYNYKLGKKHAKKQLETDLKQQISSLKNTLKNEFEKSDLFYGKNSVADAEKITNKIKNTTEPEEWKDNGNEDL